MDNSKKPVKENPRKTANFLSVFLVTWIWPLLYKGSRNGLTQEDLSKTLKIDESEALGNHLEKAWNKERAKCKQNGKKPRLRTAMFKAYYKAFIFDGVLTYAFVIAKTLTSMILAQLLLAYQSTIDLPAFNETLVIDSNNTRHGDNTTQPEAASLSSEEIINYLDYIWNDKTWLTFLLIFVSYISVFVFHHFELRQKLLGARMRVACCSIIYRKILKLSKKASSETAAGYVVNLLSNDVSRLDYAFIFVHYLWVMPVHSVVLCYLLYNVIGPAAFVGVIGLLIKTIPVQSALSKLSAKFRLKIAVCTDNRVGIMNELINGIQVIKMYAWEKPFQAFVAEARRLEIKQIRYASYVRACYLSSFVFTERSTLFITIAAMLYYDIPITADIVFSLAQYYNLLQLIAAIRYPNALSMAAEAVVSIKRVENFLNLEEHDPTLHGVVIEQNTLIQPKQPILEVNNVTASWDGGKRKAIDGVSFNVLAGKMCAIIGPVGAGKSSLLQLILGELPIQSGNIVVKGNISYGSQEPWLFPGTVQSNILFGQKFYKKRYNEVIKYCALTTDLEQLPYGDKTLVSDRGASLSGGQKARISLARAVYKMADIYLLDDPLSAVDTHVGRHLYNEVMGPEGYLAKKRAARILITHQVHFLKEADWIIAIEDGKVLQQGTYKELSNSGLDFGKLLEQDDSKNDGLEDHENEENTEVLPLMEIVNGYALIPRSDSSLTTVSMGKSNQSLYETPEVIAEEQAEGSVSLKVWARYFAGGGTVFYLTYAAFILVLSQVITSVGDYFVNIWTQQEFLRSNNLPTTYTTHECLYIYTALIVALVFFMILRGYIFFKICMRSSKNLHNNMFESILHAPMRFFDTNSSGRILNRFARDMGNIDELLPRTVLEAIQVIFVMIGILCVVIVLNPTLLLVLAGAIVLYILIIIVYLRPAQDLKRLEGIVRSPVFGHLSATLNGLTTIRVNKVQTQVSKEFDELQNVHTNSWQLTHAANTACGLWLDFISCAFVGFVAFSFIIFENNTFAGNVGLALSQSLILTGMVQFGVRQTTESIQLMTSVERIMEYSDIEPEHNPKEKPSEKWPENGKIVFDEMSYSYDADLPPVLKKLNVNINPGWKIGIVGRTGAGKSSLIGALFRLAHIEGKITIDDVDTGKISLESLRQKIAIIPQDPVLFSATIRYNLDPFGLYKDEQLWSVLEEVELKHKVGHLDYLVTEGGSNFSVGQRQLICLARAILRNNKLLVLDEATANVDPQTDILIQKTIRVKFANCTVLTIAHRLHTVMDSDRVLVMDAGFAKEFDNPHILLQNEKGYLSDMVAATGESESENLRKIAAETYKKFEEMKKIE